MPHSCVTRVYLSWFLWFYKFPYLLDACPRGLPKAVWLIFSPPRWKNFAAATNELLTATPPNLELSSLLINFQRKISSRNTWPPAVDQHLGNIDTPTWRLAVSWSFAVMCVCVHVCLCVCVCAQRREKETLKDQLPAWRQHCRVSGLEPHLSPSLVSLTINTHEHTHASMRTHTHTFSHRHTHTLC